MKEKSKKSAKSSNKKIEISVGDIFRHMGIDHGHIFVPNEEDTRKSEPFFPVGSVSTIHQIVDKIIKTASPGFEVSCQKNGRRLVSCDYSLSLHFQTVSYCRHTYPAYFQPSELTNLFFEIASKAEFFSEEFRNENHPSNQPGKIQADVYNEFIEQIRHAAAAKEFKQRVHKRAYTSTKNFNSAYTYVNELFESHGTLQVVRLNCYLPWLNDDVAMVKQAKGYLRQFSNNKRNNQLFADMAGFLWKLEFHHKHGYYFHFIFFYPDADGDKHSDLANQIGQYWIARLTKGKGSYQSCAGLLNKFLSSCIGIMEQTDVDSRGQLDQALYYMTMKDQYLRLGGAGEGKRFGRGSGVIIQ